VDDLVASAWSAEEALLSADVRRDPGRLRELLAPDFVEIGQSGRRWDRDGIIAALTGDADPVIEPVITEREAVGIGPDAVLLSYRLETGGRSSRRSSLWRSDRGAVRCVFHQGTPLPS